jgi:hypothetical protein
MALAKRTLKEMAENETDPIVRQAAKSAASMKIEDFRMLH